MKKGSKMTVEQRKRVSEGHKGQVAWNKDKGIQTNTGRTHFKKGQEPWMKGKKHSEESKKKISQSVKKAFAKPEVKKKMSEAKKGRIPWNKGKKASKEVRRKMSESSKGQVAWNKGKTGIYSEETLKKMSFASKGRPAWNKGISPSKETIEKQKKTYKNTLLNNPEIRIKIGLASKGRKLSEKHKEALLKSITGRKVSEETKGKIRESNKGLKRSEETRKNIGLAGKGRTPWNVGKRPSEETIQKQKATKEKNWRSHPELREEQSQRSRKTILKMYKSGAFPRQTNTKIEVALKEELIRRGFKEGIDFVHQFKFMDKFSCDFGFPKHKLIVEADGDFWHCNPEKYPDGATHQVQIKTIKKDKAKKAYITKVDNGSWSFLPIWGSEIKKNVAECVDRIEEVLKNKSNSS